MTYLTEESETYKDKLDAKAPEKLEQRTEQNKAKLQDINREKQAKNLKDTTAKGFYITYKIAIEGQKESPLTDALKSFGAGLLKSIGIQGFSWKTGTKGKEHTIGDLVDTLSQVFGKIDPE